MMTHVERITPIVLLNLKLQCYGQVYVIIVMHRLAKRTIGHFGKRTNTAPIEADRNNKQVILKNSACLLTV